MLKILREKFVDSAKGVLLGKRGSNEIIGFVGVMLLVLLVVFPALSTVGRTTREGVERTNTHLEAALEGQPIDVGAGGGE